ncbi:MAG: glycerol-3-phosphate 1-O-acyltransferase PlsY [Candidatus Omnitrophica bacterium]|nr:glycerol-3-phosphate 1-O-acyltransferase PlsY [Candidatus Omnitrophota bacterium]
MFIIKVILAFFIGSFPTGFILTKLLKKTDIRKEGSGNIGATNVWRVTGKIPGVLVLVIDILKGYLVVRYLTLCEPISSSLSTFEEKLILGFSVILGHTFSIFLKFKGGKGVATTAGVIFALEPKIFFICLIIWSLVFLIFRYVSLASIITAVLLPLLLLIINRPFFYILFGVSLALLVSYKHIPNIRRIILGNEPKFHL